MIPCDVRLEVAGGVERRVELLHPCTGYVPSPWRHALSCHCLFPSCRPVTTCYLLRHQTLLLHLSSHPAAATHTCHTHTHHNPDPARPWLIMAGVGLVALAGAMVTGCVMCCCNKAVRGGAF